MRRLLLSIVAALAALTAALSGIGPAPAGAEGVTDLSASVTGAPAAVSPVGGRVVYKVEFTNNGPTIVFADLRDETANGTFLAQGSTIPAGCSTPANGAANPVITCTTLAMNPGQRVTFYVAILTPTTTTTVTNTANAALSPIPVQPIDGNSADNTDTASTPVFNDPDSSASYVRQGETLTYKTHAVTVRKSTTGVIVKLSTAPADGRSCGAGALCADGLRIEFPLNDIYTASDVQVDLNFGKGEACRSITNSTCTDSLYYVGPSGGSPVLVANCTSAPAAEPFPVPCVRSMYKSPSGQLHIVAGIDSDDPDLLPQGLRLAG